MKKKAPTLIIFGSSIVREFALVAGIVMGPTFSRLFDLSKTELGVLLGADGVEILQGPGLLVGTQQLAFFQHNNMRVGQKIECDRVVDT